MNLLKIRVYILGLATLIADIAFSHTAKRVHKFGKEKV